MGKMIDQKALDSLFRETRYPQVLGLYRKREGQGACTSTVCSRAFDTTT
jgi:hypothetical protein